MSRDVYGWYGMDELEAEARQVVVAKQEALRAYAEGLNRGRFEQTNRIFQMHMDQALHDIAYEVVRREVLPARDQNEQMLQEQKQRHTINVLTPTFRAIKSNGKLTMESYADRPDTMTVRFGTHQPFQYAYSFNFSDVRESRYL